MRVIMEMCGDGDALVITFDSSIKNWIEGVNSPIMTSYCDFDWSERGNHETHITYFETLFFPFFLNLHHI